MLRRSHDHHRGLRARCNATVSADSSNQRHQDRHLMTASQSRKSAPRARWLSTGHGRARPDIQPSPQIVRQFTAIDATPRSSISRFTGRRLLEHRKSTHAPHPRRSNPHSPRRATHVPLPRFPPLEVCGRRPPCAPRHLHAAGIRKPSQKSNWRIARDGSGF